MADASAPNRSQSTAAGPPPRAPADPDPADDPRAPAGAEAPLATWAAPTGAAPAGAVVPAAAPPAAAAALAAGGRNASAWIPGIPIGESTAPVLDIPIPVAPAYGVVPGVGLRGLEPKELGLKAPGPRGLEPNELVVRLGPIVLEPRGVVPSGFSPGGLDPMGLVPRVGIPKVGVPNGDEPSAVENGVFPDSMPGEDDIPVKPPAPAALAEASGGASVEAVEPLPRPGALSVGVDVIGLRTPGLVGPPSPADGVSVGAPGTVPAGVPAAVIEAAAGADVGLEPGPVVEPGLVLAVCAAIGPAARAASTAKIPQRGIRMASMA